MFIEHIDFARHSDVVQTWYHAKEVAMAFETLYLNDFTEEQWEEMVNGPQKALWQALKRLHDL